MLFILFKPVGRLATKRMLCRCSEAPRWRKHATSADHFRANDLRSLPQVSRHKCRVDIRTSKSTDLTFPASNENGSATGTRSCKQIGDSVANHVALSQRNAKVRSRLLQQSGLGLSTPTALPELSQFRFRMM